MKFLVKVPKNNGMITKEENKHISKLLSYLLRHNPGKIGLQLDGNGWAEVKVLLRQLGKQGEEINLDILKHIVDTNIKKRFSFNEDFTKIRASQGHSIEIELNYEAQTPPPVLFHGTAEKNMAQIQEKGLLKMGRHHVHLSADEKIAYEVGRRHGTAVVLTIQSQRMFKSGYLFYVSENGVWLTDHVPAGFIFGLPKGQ